MATRPKGTKPSLVVKGARPSAKSADGSGYKLHLAMDKQSYGRLVWLQGALRAASFGEVLRRALDAYEIFDPENVVAEEGVKSDDAASPMLSADIEHLYVVISHEMKGQLDDEKSAHGRTYKETISRALCVLMQIVRERAKLVAQVKKGGDNAKDNNRCMDGINHPQLLASL